MNRRVVGERMCLFNVRRFVDQAFARDTLYGNPVASWASVGLAGLRLAFTYAPPMQ